MKITEITKKQYKTVVNSPEFKSWFGNSITVDKDGNPMVFYHGTGAKFSAFSKAKPPFFTQDKTYATGYGKGGGKQTILKVFLKIEKPFDPTIDPSHTTIHNNEFVPWAKQRYPREQERFEEILPGKRIHFFWADYFFIWLRVMAREGKYDFDGMIVDEGDFSVYPSYVPLYVNHIKSVKNTQFTDSDNILETTR